MATPTPLVLKVKHSLIGKSIIPVINQVKLHEDEASFELARLKKDHPLENYTLNELHSEFERLTGDTVKDVISLTGKEDNISTARLLLHYSIVQANVVGSPRGQSLSSSTGSSSHTPNTPVSSDNSQKQKNLEERLEKMEDNFQSLKPQKRELQVEEALRYIRVLASRPKLTAPHVLIAAIESLVEVATKNSHKDVDFFTKSLAYCRKYEDAEDLCGLALKLFGSSEDKKIASAVSEWAKSRKYDTEKTSKEFQPPNSVPPFQAQYYPPFYAGGNVNSYGVGFPFGPVPYQQSFPPRGRGPYARGRGRGRGQGNVCFYCKEIGHFVSSCPKIEQLKK